MRESFLKSFPAHPFAHFRWAFPCPSQETGPEPPKIASLQSQVLPEPLFPVPDDDGLDEVKSSIGGMDIAGSQLCGKTVPVTGETEKRMKAVLTKMPIVSHMLLVSVHRVFSGIHVHD